MLRLLSFWQKENWRSFWRRPAIYMPALLSVVLVLINWYLASRFLAQENIILRYSIYVGANWLTPARWVFLVPGVASLVIIADLSLAYVIARSSLVLKYLWLWSAVFMAAGFLWLTWLLWRINI